MLRGVAGLIDLIELGARALVICRDGTNFQIKVYELKGYVAKRDDVEISYDLQMTHEELM